MKHIFYLKGTTKRSNRPFGRMCTKPRSMPPDELPIATGMNLAASKGEFHIPHISIHLPEHEPARLSCFRRVPVLDDLGSRLDIRCQHLYLPHCICILYRVLKLLTSRCCQILLQYILSRGGFLNQQFQDINFFLPFAYQVFYLYKLQPRTTMCSTIYLLSLILIILKI